MLDLQRLRPDHEAALLDFRRTQVRLRPHEHQLARLASLRNLDIDFEQTVNISLGIPVIRTSDDHGTAFDIAGQNRADCRNMQTAMRMAVKMAAGRLSLTPPLQEAH